MQNAALTHSVAASVTELLILNEASKSVDFLMGLNIASNGRKITTRVIRLPFYFHGMLIATHFLPFKSSRFICYGCLL